MTAPQHDIIEIRSAIALLFEEGQVVELRALNVREQGRTRTYSGYFDDHELLAQQAAKLSGRADGVYVTLNDIDKALLARRSNRVQPVEKGDSTSDSHVTARRWIGIDFDPVRLSGISSTDAEHEMAIVRARQAHEYLRRNGWPALPLADSGNGAHLLCALDLPVDVGSLLKQALEAIQELFGDEHVKIDLTVDNPARIWKLYGTLAAKGDDHPERPHRVARLLEIPDDIRLVDRELLEALAASRTQPEPQGKVVSINRKTTTASPNPKIVLADWLAHNNLSVGEAQQFAGGTLYEFDVCPWNADHQDGAAWAAQFPNGALAAGCHHNGCAGKNWRALRELYDARIADAADDADTSKPRSNSQANKLLALVDESGAVFWHTAAGEAFASVPINGHIETIPLKGRAATQWLGRIFYRDTAGAVGSQALNDALNLLRGKAHFDGLLQDVFVRVGHHDGDVYVDLGDPEWRAIRITPNGWEIVPSPPVRFRRPKGYLALPDPARGGDIANLERFLNVNSSDDLLLVASFVVGAFSPQGPYPVLIFTGEQGSAKTTASRVVRALIDPSSVPVRAQPRDVRDLMVAANNNWVLAFDNLSDVHPWLSDALCRLATGGGYSTRELYTDDEEALFDAQRPVMLTGIEDLATRSDLLDRSLIEDLPKIRDTSRRDEKQFWAEFREQQPLLLGSFLDAAVLGLRDRDAIPIERLPRLADFARVAAAAAPALGWSAGEFLRAYAENRAASHVTAVEASIVGKALKAFFEEVGQWQGTATELLDQLNERAADKLRKGRTWPKTGQALANAIRRVAPNLRQIGIEVEFARLNDRQRTRVVTLSEVQGDEWDEASEASAPSAADSEWSESADACGREEFGEREVPSAVLGFEPDPADDVDAPDAQMSFASLRPSDRCLCEGCPACSGRVGKPCGAAGLGDVERAVGLCRWCAAEVQSR